MFPQSQRQGVFPQTQTLEFCFHRLRGWSVSTDTEAGSVSTNTKREGVSTAASTDTEAGGV